MSRRNTYKPGPADGADVRKDGDNWTLVLVRELHHSPSNVWEALTDPAQLREWAPFDADRNLGAAGPVTLATIGAPPGHVAESSVTRAEAPRLLEFRWGGQEVRWELKPTSTGTRLTLWHNIDRNFISMGAAGWHICLDVLDHLLAHDPLGRIAGGEAMKFDWQRLNAEYATRFGITSPSWPPKSSTA